MKVIILDFDGTIADTEKSIVETIQATMQELHLPLADESMIRAMTGIPIKQILQKVTHIEDEQEIKKIIMVYRKLYHEISLHTVQLFPDVKETLQSLYEKKIILTVASNKGTEALKKLLQSLGIAPYISIALGEHDVVHKKPAPDMALHILKATNAKPEETLIVGDTIYDIAMGKATQCITCGVDYTHQHRKQLQQQGADFIIESFNELLNIV